ncbi:hypothetical protein MACK_002755 [Theileria orientalis]|uniref:NOT2/NOT3/NOT5 C-terminal domain-containing protein n=1 Tax=Theileria orientalis TaxID=68886 RepID=A0A976MDZ8_THEOR|nr:hypothetical protein MACK_002755 [Theileria orientalis]
MVLDISLATKEQLATESLNDDESIQNDLDKLSNSFEDLNFVDRNISDLKRELTSIDKEEGFDENHFLLENDDNTPEENYSEAEVGSKADSQQPGSPAKGYSAPEIQQDQARFGLEGIFDAMKTYFTDKSPFLPTGKLDTEPLKQRLLQENPQPQRTLDEDSIFFDRCLSNYNYGKTTSFRNSNFPKLSLETVFYVFYNVPRDAVQDMAAKELFKRQWKYHEKNKLWFKKDQEKLTWIYFDPACWCTRSLNLTAEVESSLMSREDLDKLSENHD